MKKFICFLFCSFMMLFTSLGVQASSFSESIPSKSVDAPISFVDTPTVQAGVISIAPMNVLAINIAPPLCSIEIITIENKPTVVPKCPFRYLYPSQPDCLHGRYSDIRPAQHSLRTHRYVQLRHNVLAYKVFDPAGALSAGLTQSPAANIGP